MIHAVFHTSDGELLFTCDGHALADEPGRDIVCAAVSTAVELMQRLLTPTRYSVKDGSVALAVERPARPKDAQAAYRWWSRRCEDWQVFRRFFDDLAGRWPDRIDCTEI